MPLKYNFTMLKTETLMVNNERRTVLKVLGGTAVIATMPSFANGSVIDISGKSRCNKQTIAISADSELVVALSVDPDPTIELINNSDKLVIVRHVHPGIIHAGKKTFDINSIFARSAYAIGAGRTRRVKIEPTYATQAEVQFPRHKYANQPQRLVSVTGTNQRGMVVNSSRSFYA